MSFDFIGNDPDQVGNLTRQLEETRLVVQEVQAENVALRRRVQELTQLTGPNDYTLLVVKMFN